MQLNGKDAAARIRMLVKSGWSEPELAVRLALRSTTTFRKWAEGHCPLPGTSAALKRIKPRSRLESAK